MNEDTRRSSYFPLDLQLSARAWESYRLPAELLDPQPTSRLYPLHLLAATLRQQPGLSQLSTGQLNLLALLTRALRTVADAYLAARGAQIGLRELRCGERSQPLPELPRVLSSCVACYPPAQVRRGTAAESFLAGPAERSATAVELFVLATQLDNPAAAPLISLFDDVDLRQACDYRQTLRLLDSHLAGSEATGVLRGSLLALLRAPIEAAPDSLAGQLAFIKQTWSELLPEAMFDELLRAFDLIAEENAPRGGGPGPAQVADYRPDEHWDEPEAFTRDADWMPNVVQLAKTIYVWLDQLSRKYQRPIQRLDQIPDAELAALARWGFNALWLIGLWERSPASQRIKQLRGNPEAVASAYSLVDYVVAADLGGEAALNELQQRCARWGIALASDVVPNHTGIDSRWMAEHPDWFLQLPHSPYPGYRFNGPDLSSNPEVSLYIEDGYWDHSDAAVTFLHLDRRSGRARHIYHGNDGTHMPWNDTAQLNYLLPEVREAMIQTILRVARSFRVIRFDAAMTLAKKHFQRLWFPQPGGGAGVPSRSGYGMSRQDFEAAFPVEFWREVVDRVAAEVPDTLLIAEAFWLMESYFVRTLGMHRVYNSAFMNMLKQEENAKYRTVLKQTLAFNPEILQRFVNFMNNPDEETAVEQFGKGDKYFGVAVLLATLPGLPMFGHGQIEGLREKYGMEYRRAYWDETPDQPFIRHHENQIFPLLRRRRLFSGASAFQLYDFVSGGRIEENVYAYSNSLGEERALVVYHNHPGSTGGWLRQAVPRAIAGGDDPITECLSLVEGLGLPTGSNWFVRCREHCSGQEFLLSTQQLADQGLYLQLGPYHYRVFLDLQPLLDQDGRWAALHHQLQGRGVDDLDRERRKLVLGHLLEASRKALALPLLTQLAELLEHPPSSWSQQPVVESFGQRFTALLELLQPHLRQSLPAAARLQNFWHELAQLQRLLTLTSRSAAEGKLLALWQAPLLEQPPGPRRRELRQVLIPWLALRQLADPVAGPGAELQTAEQIDNLLLADGLEQALPPESAFESALLLRLLARHGGFWGGQTPAAEFATLFADPQVKRFVGLHWAEGAQWFHQERFETLAFWLGVSGALTRLKHQTTKTAALAALLPLQKLHDEVVEGAAKAGYRLAEFALGNGAQPKAAKTPAKVKKPAKTKAPKDG